MQTGLVLGDWGEPLMTIRTICNTTGSRSRLAMGSHVPGVSHSDMKSHCDCLLALFF